MVFTAQQRWRLKGLALTLCVASLVLGACGATVSLDAPVAERTAPLTASGAEGSLTVAADPTSSRSGPVDAVRAAFEALDEGAPLPSTVCIQTETPTAYVASFEAGPELVCAVPDTDADTDTDSTADIDSTAEGAPTYVLAFSSSLDDDMAELLHDIAPSQRVDLGAGEGVLGQHCLVKGLLPECAATWRTRDFIVVVWGSDRSATDQTEYLRANLVALLEAAATAA